METATMGKVLVAAKIENIEDLVCLDKGLITAEQIRSVEVTDALVDTGATGLLMPKRLISLLGLKSQPTRLAQGIGGKVPLPMYGTVRLTVQGRQCPMDVAEIGDELPVLIGQVPLELLDFVVDPKRNQLIGNPAHGGEHMIEALGSY